MREAIDNTDMEAVTDAAALIGRVLSHVSGEAAVLAHEEAPRVAAGLSAMAHRCADQEASLLAMEALRAMLDSAPMRPATVSQESLYTVGFYSKYSRALTVRICVGSCVEYSGWGVALSARQLAGARL